MNHASLKQVYYIDITVVYINNLVWFLQFDYCVDSLLHSLLKADQYLNYQESTIL